MQLTLWTYEGPPHVGAMRIATAMTDVHYVLHAPQGDTYADLLFTMIERRSQRTPVTYTTFQARDLGGDTAELFQNACREAHARFNPGAMLVGASCTAELLQDNPAGLAGALRLPIPVIPLELPAYQKKENWGAAETFYRLVRTLTESPRRRLRPRPWRRRPQAALQHPRPHGARLPPSRRCRGDHAGCSTSSGSRSPASRRWVRSVGRRSPRIPDADFNVSLYPEIADTTVALAGAQLPPALHEGDPDRHRRDAGLHPRGR